MTEKRFTYDSKTDSILKDGEFWLDGSVYTACNHSEICDELNALNDESEQLKSDKEHLMGCLIRFFGYDDEDIDYNLNRESNRKYGKQYYSMKEETKKELEK